VVRRVVPAPRAQEALAEIELARVDLDALAVARTRISPPVHTGIAHIQPGIGQIGAGITHPPIQAFDEFAALVSPAVA